MTRRASSLATVLVLAALSAAPAQAAEDQLFTGPVAGVPALGVAADGQAVLAWTTGSAVRASIRSAGGAFGSAVRISSGGPASRNFALAVGRDGTAVLVWQRVTSRGALTGPLLASVRRPNGDFRTAVALPGSSGGRTPAVAVGADGAVLVGWRTLGASGCGGFVEAATARPGAAFGAARRVSSSCANARELRAALSADDSGAVVWQTGRSSSSYTLEAAPFSQRAFGAPRRLTAGPIVGGSAAATGIDMGVAVVWRARTSANRNGARGPVRLARLTPPRVVSPARASISDRIIGVPRVAGRPDGSLLISWEQGGLQPEVAIAPGSVAGTLSMPVTVDACGASDASRVYPVPALSTAGAAVAFQSSCMSRFGLGTDYGIAAVRQTAGTWQQPFGVSLGAYARGLTAGSSDAGELIIAWVEGALRVRG